MGLLSWPTRRQLPNLGTLPADEILAEVEVFTFGRMGGSVMGSFSQGRCHGMASSLFGKVTVPSSNLVQPVQRNCDEFKLKVKSQHQLESQ